MQYPSEGALGLYQDNSNEDVPTATENIFENIIDKVHLTGDIQKTPTYNIEMLNLDILRKQQQHDQFHKNSVEEIKTSLDPNFLLDENSIFRKVVKLKYTVEQTIVHLEN